MAGPIDSVTAIQTAFREDMVAIDAAELGAAPHLLGGHRWSKRRSI